MKILLRVPGYSDVTFDNYEDLNVIWQILENYKNCELKIISDDNNDDIQTQIESDEQTEVKEAIESIDEKDNTATLAYIVPKSITFTQRFQERVNKEITAILNSVYPDSFIITNISYKDIETDKENMQMVISIEANDSKGMENLKYLDSNVEYIMKDIIDYYL